jgi:hypothetical protein
MKKTGLSLRAPTQGVRAEIDLIAVVVKPEDTVTVIFKLEIVKAGGIDPKEVEHLPFCKYRAQINDTGKAILPDDLDDAEYNWLRTVHGDYVSHGTLSLSPPEAITDHPTHQE